MHSLPALITDLTLISIYAGITTILFKWLKQPVVLGYVIAGIIAGPYLTLFPSVTDNENLTVWADIGVIFLLFSLGLEFSFKKIVNVGKTAIITASANIIFLLFLGYNTGLMLGWTPIDSIFLGGMISMSSTTIIIKAFEELNLKKLKFTDLVFGVLVIEDIVGILLLVLLPTVALSQSVNGAELVSSTLKLIFFLVLCFVTGVYIVPTFIKKVATFITDEMLLITSVALCLGMVLLATSSGFSSALGAFIMGSILAESSVVHRIENVLKPVKDFFGAVFFVSVGMMVNPAMFIEYAWPIFCISVIVVLGKVFFSCFGFMISGQTLKTSLLCGFSLAQVGEFAFIIAALGMSLGVLSEYVYPTIVAVSVITTFTTPMMINAAIPTYNKLNQIMPKKVKEFINRNLEHTSPDTKSDIQQWNSLFKLYFLKISLFSIILISIMNVFYLIQPYVREWIPGLNGRILLTSVALLAMAPFLYALLASKGKISQLYLDLWVSNKANRIPLIALMAFRLMIAALFVMMVIHQLLTINAYVTFVLVVLSIASLFKSKWVMGQYMRIETHFLINLNREQVEKQVKENADESNKTLLSADEKWLDSSLDVQRFVIEPESSFIDKELKETIFREKFALNIFKIVRGKQIINLPWGSEKLLEGDILTIVGTGKQLSKFKTAARKKGIRVKETNDIPEEPINLHDYILNQEKDKTDIEKGEAKDDSILLCCAFLITPESELVNHTLQDSDLSNKSKCIVVGVERKSSLFINPESNFVFEEGDLLWLVGERKMVTKEVLHQVALQPTSAF